MKGLRKPKVVSQNTIFELMCVVISVERAKKKSKLVWDQIIYYTHNSIFTCFVISFLASVSHSVLLEVLFSKLIISQKKKAKQKHLHFFVPHQPPESRISSVKNFSHHKLN